MDVPKDSEHINHMNSDCLNYRIIIIEPKNFDLSNFNQNSK